jgi:predicted acylesterase/phospholipase RssA
MTVFEDVFAKEREIIAKKVRLRVSPMREDPDGGQGATPVRRTTIFGGVTIDSGQSPLAEGAFYESDLFGIALSGGGIRSASFSIGVLQALERLNVLRYLHYMSSVSGGGYTAAALSWQSHQHKTLSRWHFAFGEPWRGAKNETKFGLLDLVRHQADYLRPNVGLGTFALLAVSALNVLVSLAIYFSILVLLLQVLLKIRNVFGAIPWLSQWRAISLVGLISGFVLFWLAFGYLLHTWFGVNERAAFRRYQVRIRLTTAASYVLIVTIAAGAVACLPLWVSSKFIPSSWENVSYPSVAVIAVCVMTVLVGAVWQWIAGVNAATRSLAAVPTSSRVPIVGAAAAAIYLLTSVCYWFVKFKMPDAMCVYVFLAVSISLGFLTNINFFGLHRLYRDRLAETFLPNKSNVNKNRWGLATEVISAHLADMGGASDPGLYHLLNANLVIGTHQSLVYRRRGNDNFIFSHAFFGSGATGWHESRKFGRRDASLATAMAISGAAINPNAAGGGVGVTRNWFVATIMALLNLRLGYWVVNPNAGNPRFPSLTLLLPWPNFLVPLLYPGLAGRTSETSHYLELTDGGHFDNTAIYELVRRRLRLIILVDAGADPDYQFDDLSNVIEKIRVDFGTKIEFLDDRALDDIAPRSGGDDAYLTRLGFARRGHAVARIVYRRSSRLGERDETGTLIIIKPTMVADLPHDIYHYRLHHESFPSETTTNQFFSERQMEAYRELGYQLTKRMVEDAKVTDWFAH